MDARVFLQRLFNPNVKLSTRFNQAMNAVLLPFVGRSLGIVHVVEFPKSGGSWIRNMIRAYLGTEAYSHNRLLYRNAVVQAHRLYSRTFPRPVVVVRDPRDLFTSFYHYEVNFDGRAKPLAIGHGFVHDPALDVKDDFTQYLRAKLNVPSHPWFFYSQFVESWRDHPGVCFVRYEDFLTGPEEQLIRILEFIGEPVDLDRVKQAVELNSFKKQTEIRYGAARVGGVADSSKFLRKGVAGDWRNHFNAESCQLIEQAEGQTLRAFGYVDSESWIDDFLSEADEGRATL